MLNAWEDVSASSTDEVLVDGITGKKIRVRSFIINQGDTTASTVVFNSKGTGAGTAISPTFKFAANGGVIGDNPTGWFETAAGEALTVSTGSGSDTGILVTYDRVRG